MRNKLIELLNKIQLHGFDPPADAERYDPIYPTNEEIADHLINNGVIIPPCKVGDTVWFETWKKNATECIGIRPHTVDRIDVIAVCDIKGFTPTKLHDWEFGKNAFLTQEKAEKALEDMRGEKNERQ